MLAVATWPQAEVLIYDTNYSLHDVISLDVPPVGISWIGNSVIAASDFGYDYPGTKDSISFWKVRN